MVKQATYIVVLGIHVHEPMRAQPITMHMHGSLYIRCLVIRTTITREVYRVWIALNCETYIRRCMMCHCTPVKLHNIIQDIIIMSCDHCNHFTVTHVMHMHF